MMTRTLFLMLSFIMLLMPAVTFGHDLIQPAWRGEDGATYQEWSFSSDDNPAAPENVSNDFGPPSAAITTGDFASGWLEDAIVFGSQTGIWDLGQSGSISLDIPNSSATGGYKEIWLQVTYFSDESFVYSPEINVTGAEFLSDQWETMLVEEAPAPGGQWLLEKSVWRIYPNPQSEQVVITSDPMFTSMIDQIVVDTICVPEPFSCVLLGLGCLLLRRKRPLKEAKQP
jgi:hypothetical protein